LQKKNKVSYNNAIKTHRARSVAAIVGGRVIAALIFVWVQTAHAGSADWLSSPADSNWNNGANWTSGGPPNGSSDIATFADSNNNLVNVGDATEVSGIVFNDPSMSAPQYSIQVADAIFFNITGAGITNNTSNTEFFVTLSDNDFGGIFFKNSASAGSHTDFTATAATASGGQGSTVAFSNTSTAAHGTFRAYGGDVDGASGGQLRFFNSATAASGTFTSFGGSATSAGGAFISFFNSSNAGAATITNNAAIFSTSAGGGQTVFGNTTSAMTASIHNNGSAAVNVSSGHTIFNDNATAGSATIINNGGTGNQGHGGLTGFTDTSDAGSASLVANPGTNGGFGGIIGFADNSTGGTSHVSIFGNGSLDLRGHTGSLTIGSLDGDGGVVANGNNLTVGSNDASTEFSGRFFDLGSGASLSKIGSGTLTLSAFGNNFTGGTTLAGGALVVTVDGALGSGNVSLTGPDVVLTLQTGVMNNYIGDGANLSLVSGAKVDLNFTGGGDVVNGLVLGGVVQANGTYDASNTSAYFTGTGSIIVVPEPSSIALLAIGAISFVYIRRKKTL
jgi:autotransporter-associated beta strand protein